MSSILIPGSVEGPEPHGLTTAEVDDRVRHGQTNLVPEPPTRTVYGIAQANVLTPVNFVIAVLAALVLAAGSPKDAIFAGVIVANSAIGIIQEVRAKRVLDSLRVLTTPAARVRRNGVTERLPVEGLVLDDVIELRSGDQVPADAVIVVSDHLDVDESLLTGEANPVAAGEGDRVMSGSTVIAGTGFAQVTAVGAEGYAARLAAEARRFTLVDSVLRNDINRIVTVVGIAMVPIGALLAASQFLRTDDGWRTSLIGTVAGLVGMVPEGLVLLTSVAFAAGVIRLARHGCLVQELPAIEVLARVDVLCADKTGTITSGAMTLVEVAEFEPGATATLAAIAAADPDPNITMRAIAEGLGPSEPANIVDRTPFSSARRSSSVTLAGGGVWALGAPDPDDPAVRAHTTEGRRVLELSQGDRRAALVVLDDVIRPDAPATLAWFADQGVTVRVLSGDDQTTVTAIARRAGVDPGPPDDPTVLGRVDPHRKRDLVNELQQAGHTVAMTGDGVNDVLALKAADCGIAMASGSEASRAVAQLVMLDSEFAALPEVVGEGRRVINNIERVASLFLAKTTYSVALSLVIGIIGASYPLRPIHLTLLSWFTIGIPATLLALESDTSPARPGFMRRVLERSVPAGLWVAITVLVTDVITDSAAPVIAAGVVALTHLAIVASPLTTGRAAILGVAMTGFVVIIATRPLRRLFELQSATAGDLVIGLTVGGLASLGLWLVTLLIRRGRRSRTATPVRH